jgi:hypothetical protein
MTASFNTILVYPVLCGYISFLLLFFRSCLFGAFDVHSCLGQTTVCAVILAPLFQNSVGYHMSVTRLPTKKEVQEEVTAGCKLCPEAVRRTLSTMLDMSLLRSPTFLLLCLSGFITMMGFYVPFMYVTGE